MPTRYRYRLLVVIWLVYVVNLVDRGIATTLLPLIRQSLHLSLFVMGAVTSSFFLAYIVGNLFGGYFSDRFGSRLLLKIITISFTLVTALTGFIRTGVQFIFLRMGLGLLEAPDTGATYGLLARWFPAKERGKGNSWFLTAYPIGSLLPPLIAIPLAKAFGGWQSVFYFMLIPGIICFFLVQRVVYNKPKDALEKGKMNQLEFETLARDMAKENSGHEKKGGEAKEVRRILRDANLWLITLATFCQLALTYGFNLWASTYLMEALHFPIEKMGLLLVILSVGGLIGTLITGRLHDGYLSGRNKPMFVTFFLVMGVCLFMLSTIKSANQIGLLIVFLALLGFAMFANYVPLATILQKRYSSNVMGTATGVVNGTAQVGSFIIPTLAGALIGHTAQGLNFQYVFLLFLGFAILGALSSLFLADKPLVSPNNTDISTNTNILLDPLDVENTITNTDYY